MAGLGANYEIPVSASLALDTSSQVTAPTVFNFNSPNAYTSADQSQPSTATATSSAALGNASATGGGGTGTSGGQAPSNDTWVIVGIAVSVLVAWYEYRKHKKGK